MFEPFGWGSIHMPHKLRAQNKWLSGFVCPWVCVRITTVSSRTLSSPQKKSHNFSCCPSVFSASPLPALAVRKLTAESNVSEKEPRRLTEEYTHSKGEVTEATAHPCPQEADSDHSWCSAPFYAAQDTSPETGCSGLRVGSST